MRRGIQENNKSFFYTKMVGKEDVEVSLSLGWITIKENEGHTGPFGVMGKCRYNTMSMTIEDARNLIAAIQELIPQEETGKYSPGTTAKG